MGDQSQFEVPEVLLELPGREPHREHDQEQHDELGDHERPDALDDLLHADLGHAADHVEHGADRRRDQADRVVDDEEDPEIDRIDAGLIAEAGPDLKLIASFSNGIDNVDVEVNEGETLHFTVRAVDTDHDAVQLDLLHDDSTPPGVSMRSPAQ